MGPREGFITMPLDPIRYEIFRHRLFNILEEGRIAIKMVSGSAVVVEGGETMCSFYTSEGIPILTAAGILIHCTGARDFILKAIEWYEEDPGIDDGDQLFFNDPYIGGQHLPDQIIIKPIFYEGKRIAWTGCFVHTPETGGIEPGGQPPSATEIFHEGIRILGLKIVERGKFRKDVFKTIVEQVRDPHLIGLDTKAKIAANNVCTRGYLKLIEQFGYDFVENASRQIIDDSEVMARARLRSLPDGAWQSRMYGDTYGKYEKPFRVVCTMSKEDAEVTFDFTGSSEQVEGAINSTLPATWGRMFVVLAGQLFWNVPWNGGMITPVKLIAPEGTVVNCRFPAAVSLAVISTGGLISATAHECVAKMLYAAGIHEDVNAGWSGATGNTPFFGGVNQYGSPCGGVILDTFASGVGATPYRDGVDTGAEAMNPTSCISDVEIIEMNLPFMYLGRRNLPDGGGFGKYTGGMGPEMIYMVYGTERFGLGTIGLGRKTPNNWGMFGGYPTAPLQAIMVVDSDIRDWFRESRCPRDVGDIEKLKGRKFYVPPSSPLKPVKSYDLLLVRKGSGGGFGDPLDRDPHRVVADFHRQAISLETAREVYGVVFDPETLALDEEATRQLGKTLRGERLRVAKPTSEVLGPPL